MPFRRSKTKGWFPSSRVFRLGAWSVLACLAWTGSFLLRDHPAQPHPGWILLKGWVLLAGAASVFACFPRDKEGWLGAFPLMWLACSHTQWDLCVNWEYRYWAWLVVFLLVQVLTLSLRDGRVLCATLLLPWAFLSRSFKFAFLMPLAFLTTGPKTLSHAAWVKWGSLAAGVALFIVLEGRWYVQWDFEELFSLAVDRRYGAFFLLGCLGSVLAEGKSTGAFPQAVQAFLWMTVGFLFFTGSGPVAFWELELLQWVWVLMAGFGLEALRVRILGDTWPERSLWAALGIALGGGIIGG